MKKKWKWWQKSESGNERKKQSDCEEDNFKDDVQFQYAICTIHFTEWIVKNSNFIMQFCTIHSVKKSDISEIYSDGIILVQIWKDKFKDCVQFYYAIL